MGWQDDPIVSSAPPRTSAAPTWASDPIVGRAPGAAPAPPAAEESLGNRALKAWDSKWNPLRFGVFGPANVETSANIGSSMLSVPLAGLAGIAQGAWNTVVPKRFEGPSAGNRVGQVEEALTYQPRTASGKATSEIVQYPFAKLAQGADAAGGATARVTGSPAAGALVNTAIQMAPALITHALPKGASAAARGGAADAAADSGGAAPRPTPTIAEAPEVTAAKDYVSRRTSLDWNSLSDAVKSRLTQIARDSKSLEGLDPAAVERQAGLESLPVPLRATRGQLTRDRGELANEGTLAATSQGGELAAVRDAQSPGIVANLEVLKGKVSGTGKTQATAQTPQQVGLSVQDQALRQKAAASKANYDSLYDTARKTEPNATVSGAPLAQLLDQNPAVQHLGFMSSWLKRAGFENTETTGGITVKTQRPVKLAELADLREEAAGIARTGGTDGFYAGKVVRAIDQARAQAPEAAQAWKAADAAFRKHKMEFSDQGAVEQLVENKSRTDRTVALEDTFNKTVLGGSLEDLSNVKRSLLTGGDGATRMAGRKAWRDIRAQTIQHIIDESTKSSATLPNGSTPVSAAGMQRALNAIGPEKLDSIFGPGTSSMIDRINRATKELRTEPPRIHPGSSTMGNVVAFLERNLNRVPLLGDIASGTVKAVQKVRELGATGREVRAAQVTPLDEGATLTENAIARQRSTNALARSAPYSSATQGARR